MLSFSVGDVLYSAGDMCENAFVIVSGEVEIARGEQRRVIGKGEVCGSLSLVRGMPHDDTAVACSPVTAELLSREQIEDLVSKLQLMTDDPQGVPAAVLMENPAHMRSDMDHITSTLDRFCDTLERKLNGDGSSHVADDDLAASGELDQSDLGEIAPLINDDSINDILINGHNNVYVERSGILQKTDVVFKDDKAVYDLARTIAKDMGRKIDPTRPLIDARLLDGSRVNIIAPPLAVDGTSISIRKFAKKKITLEAMVEKKNLSNEICEFLKVVGKCRLNIVISGGTGSGKTTLLNAISQFIDPAERVVTIEDAAELKLQQPHVVRLETRPHHIGMKAGEEVSIRDLVKNALRMRPDRIIVGEVRGPEAFDMLQAMNTGHEGSLTTVHSNHPRDALSRLENMISMADLQIPMKSLRYQIASALHLIVQISRMRDGQRRITYISEIVGMEGDMITMHDLFTYKVDGEDESGKIIGKFKWSGIVPRFTRRVEYYGELPRLEAALGVKFPKAQIVGKK